MDVFRCSLLGFARFLPLVIFPVLLPRPRSFTELSRCARWTDPPLGSVIREVKLHSLFFRSPSFVIEEKGQEDNLFQGNRHIFV